MVDVVSTKKRSEMMGGIRGKDTKPEVYVRSILHRQGFRFRLDNKGLPGRPDLKLKKYNAIIQVQGCFWHAHDCHLFRLPKSREVFWRNKLAGNRARDLKNREQCFQLGWRVMEVWECATKGKSRLGELQISSQMNDWLKSDSQFVEIRGIRD